MESRKKLLFPWEKEAELSSLAGYHVQWSSRPREAFAYSCLKSNFVNRALGEKSKSSCNTLVDFYICKQFPHD